MAGGRYEIVVPQRRNALRKAGRHSARVRFMRLAIIVFATLTIACITIIALFDPFKHLPISVSVASVKLDGTQVITAEPKLTGYRKDGRAYQVVATSGIQDLLDTNVTKLLGVKAMISLGDDSTARVTADNGVHDSVHDLIKLSGNVQIRNVIGYEFFMNSMSMDFKTSDIVTDDHATLLLNGARFEGDRMSISDNGHKVTFEGSVTSIIDPESTDTSVGALTSAEK
jgi:lipopolysaccharide export system protein LptC